MQSRVVPYVVAVDRLGEPRAIAPAGERYQPTDPQVAWFLAHFIAGVRSVSLDPVTLTISKPSWSGVLNILHGPVRVIPLVIAFIFA